MKVVYVRNLSPAIDETKLNELFKQYGAVEKVKKLKDYAFIHFVDREDAVRAIEELDGQELDDLKIQVSLAKPQVDKTAQRRGQSGFGALNNRGKPGENMPMRGRGRGGYGGNYSGGYGGRDSGGGYGGYDDGYSQRGYGGYDDASYDSYYAPPSRGRGQMGRGGMRGRGGPSNSRGGSMGSRGGPMGVRRGSPMNNRGSPSRGGSRGMMQRGGPRGGGGMSRGAPYGGGSYGGGSYGGNSYGGGGRGMPPKRKADFDSYGSPPKRKPNDAGGWNSKPIAQQPLNKSNNYYNDDYSGQEWYTDLSTPRWQ